MAEHYLSTSDSEFTECGRSRHKIMSSVIGGSAQGVTCKQCLKRLVARGVAMDDIQTNNRILSAQEICSKSINSNCTHCTVRLTGKPTGIPCQQYEDKMIVAQEQLAKADKEWVETIENFLASNEYFAHRPERLEKWQQLKCDMGVQQ